MIRTSSPSKTDRHLNSSIFSINTEEKPEKLMNKKLNSSVSNRFPMTYKSKERRHSKVANLSTIQSIMTENH